MGLPQIVLVYRALIVDSKGKILLVKRADTDSWAASTWEFPGGKFDDGQDIDKVIHREIQEETGLSIEVDPGLAFHENHMITEGKYAGLPFLIVTLLVKEFSGEVKLSHEHSDFGWFDYDECLEMDLNQPTRNALIGFKQIL